MPKQTNRRGQAVRRAPRARQPVQGQGVAPQASASAGQAGPQASSLDTLKQNIKRIDKGSMFEALKRVKDMRPEEWKDAGSVRQLTESIAKDIGIKVDSRRLDAFMNAFNDATKNADGKGPKVSVEEIAKRYGSDIDDKTIKEIKKFVK